MWHDRHSYLIALSILYSVLLLHIIIQMEKILIVFFAVVVCLLLC